MATSAYSQVPRLVVRHSSEAPDNSHTPNIPDGPIEIRNSTAKSKSRTKTKTTSADSSSVESSSRNPSALQSRSGSYTESMTAPCYRFMIYCYVVLLRDIIMLMRGFKKFTTIRLYTSLHRRGAPRANRASRIVWGVLLLLLLQRHHRKRVLMVGM